MTKPSMAESNQKLLQWETPALQKVWLVVTETQTCLGSWRLLQPHPQILCTPAQLLTHPGAWLQVGPPTRQEFYILGASLTGHGDASESAGGVGRREGQKRNRKHPNLVITAIDTDSCPEMLRKMLKSHREPYSVLCNNV